MAVITAQQSADFASSIGVNTHISWSGPWSNWSNLEAELAYTGIENVRDSTPIANFDLSEYQQLAAMGTKFDVITTGPNVDLSTDLANIDTLEKSNPGSVASIEGTNEFNVNHDIFNGLDSFGNPAWGAGLDLALHNAVAADTTLRGKTVVAASLADADAAEIQQQGNVSSSVGASNWHAYFGQGSQPGDAIQSAVDNAQSVAPGRPVYITESGYYTAVDAQQWGGGGVNADAQAKMTVNLLMDARKDGAAMTFIYGLMDNTTNPSSSDLENSFGLFNGDGTPKAAATALHNLTSLTADTGSTAKTFTPGSLQYSMSGTTSQDNSLLLEKSDGEFDLALWNEQPIWNETTKTEIPATTHNVTVTLGGTADVKVYDILTGSLVSQSKNAASVSVAMSDRPMIVDIAPSAPPATPVCFVTGTRIRTARGDVLVEDLSIGDVAFTATGGLRPIVWIGHRDMECCGHLAACPIRVAAHAFDASQPARDLLLSPGHPVLVGADADNEGGRLVPIICLVNGTSIRHEAVDRVTYWHVELDSHDILLAEGLPAESYLDCGDRTFFTQGTADRLANPDFVVPGMGCRCRPVSIDDSAVEAARRRLDVRFTKRLAQACAWPGEMSLAFG